LTPRAEKATVVRHPANSSRTVNSVRRARIRGPGGPVLVLLSWLVMGDSSGVYRRAAAALYIFSISYILYIAGTAALT
jgi:hypothetical protein